MKSEAFEKLFGDPSKGEPNLKRSFTLNRAALTFDDEARTIEVAFSSENPVRQWFGFEILDHKTGSCDFSRLSDGACVLVNHNEDDQVGVVESARIDADKIGRALLRFGKSARATEIWNDLKDGIRKHISFGYEIVDIKFESETGGVETYRTVSWMPFEISVVPIPADTKTGVGRSKQNFNTEEQKNMRILRNPTVTEGGGTVTDADRKKIQTDERSRQTGIRSIAGKLKRPEAEVEKAIGDGTTLDEYRALVLDAYNPKPLDMSHANIGLDEKQKRSYSITRAIRCLSEQGGRLDGLELEASQEVAKKLGENPTGFFIPTDVIVEQRDFRAGAHLMRALLASRALSVGTDADGGYLVPTNLDSTNFISMLRNQIVAVRMGAKMLTGLEGDLDIPKQTAGATAYSLAEAATVTGSQQTFGQLQLRPKRIAASTTYSKNLVNQSSLDVENLVRLDLTSVLSIKQDYLAINGSGSSNEPTGILNMSGLSVVALGTNGAAPTWQSMLDLETEIASGNADLGSLAYVGSTQARGKMKGTVKVAGFPQYLWENGATPGEGIVNGYRAIASNQIPSNLAKGSGTNLSGLIFGNWADLYLAMWGAFDVVVDNITLADKYQVKVTMNILNDVGARHEESFAAIKDMLTTP